MPITLTPYKILAMIGALLLTMIVSGFGGWHVRGWHDDSKQLKAANAAVVSLQNGFAGVVTASNNLAATISGQNKATENSIAELTLALGNQDHALAQLRQDIKTIPVGNCSFTPDADSMYQRAYQAAFGGPGYPATQAGKAGGGNAVHPATPSARGHQ